jgi:predicted RNA-binding protein YlxR (DUF448 family)
MMAAAMPKAAIAQGHPAPRGKRANGPRPKHVPQRMCIACRRHDAKRGLIRLVRTPEGTVEVDTTGRRNGRGAYLCHQPECWEKALSSGLLGRALRIDIGAETVELLRRHAATLQPEPPVAASEGGTT